MPRPCRTGVIALSDEAPAETPAPKRRGTKGEKASSPRERLDALLRASEPEPLTVAQSNRLLLDVLSLLREALGPAVISDGQYRDLSDRYARRRRTESSPADMSSDGPHLVVSAAETVGTDLVEASGAHVENPGEIRALVAKLTACAAMEMAGHPEAADGLLEELSRTTRVDPTTVELLDLLPAGTGGRHVDPRFSYAKLLLVTRQILSGLSDSGPPLQLYDLVAEWRARLGDGPLRAPSEAPAFHSRRSRYRGALTVWRRGREPAQLRAEGYLGFQKPSDITRLLQALSLPDDALATFDVMFCFQGARIDDPTLPDRLRAFFADANRSTPAVLVDYLQRSTAKPLRRPEGLGLDDDAFLIPMLDILKIPTDPETVRRLRERYFELPVRNLSVLKGITHELETRQSAAHADTYDVRGLPEILEPGEAERVTLPPPLPKEMEAALERWLPFGPVFRDRVARAYASPASVAAGAKTRLLMLVHKPGYFEALKQRMMEDSPKGHAAAVELYVDVLTAMRDLLGPQTVPDPLFRTLLEKLIRDVEIDARWDNMNSAGIVGSELLKHFRSGGEMVLAFAHELGHQFSFGLGLNRNQMGARGQLDEFLADVYAFALAEKLGHPELAKEFLEAMVDERTGQPDYPSRQLLASELPPVGAPPSAIAPSDFSYVILLSRTLSEVDRHQKQATHTPLLPTDLIAEWRRSPIPGLRLRQADEPRILRRR